VQAEDIRLNLARVSGNRYLNTESLLQSPSILIEATGTPQDMSHVAPPLRRLWVEQFGRSVHLDAKNDKRRRYTDDDRATGGLPVLPGTLKSGELSKQLGVLDMKLSNVVVGHNG